jgi:excalibur calcium-binding domain-containing protein
MGWGQKPGSQHSDPKVVDFEKRRKQAQMPKPKPKKPRTSGILQRPGMQVVIAIVVVALVGAGAFLFNLQHYATKFGSWDLAWRHVTSQSNCDAARRINLASARKGAPGYYPQHDADDDGIACEPYRGR